MPGTSLTGRLIVATPELEDPNFRRTVVLLLEHGPEGAIGVVLDRPLELPVAEALPTWSGYAVAPPVLFSGGPVEADAAIALGRLRHPCVDPAPFGRAVSDDLVTIDLDAAPASAEGVLVALRVYAGYAGWGPGQLDAEVATGSWFVLDADPGDLWSDRPEALWRSVLRRQPGAVAMFAGFPEDPTHN
ncbi:MAG: YqgE/AlgH family protein [Actinomycetes bacterium]